MKLIIEITCDNAAFNENGMEIECAMVLRDVAQNVEDGQSKGSARDTNGNIVGSFHFDESD